MFPPRVVLAPVDFSEPSRVALVLAAHLARHVGATLHVVYAEDPLLTEAARHAGYDLTADATEELARFVASAAPAAELAPDRHVAAGHAVEVILLAAGRIHADLIVVGSHGMSGAERLVFGSTTEGLLRQAAMPVLVVPPSWTAGPRGLSGTGPVIAAVDFSEASRSAARAACQLAAALGAGAELVHVVPQLPVPARWRAHADAVVDDRLAAARRELDALVTTLGRVVPVQVTVTTGSVAASLATSAAPSATRRPILVLGRRAPGARGGAPGATAYRVLTLANVPVLMHVD